MIETAAKILDVKPDEIQEFSALDIFNNNLLQGVICKRSDYRYGTMILFQINGVQTRQIIYCTPKLEYPFDKRGNFHWPKIIQLEIWDKLDGTNILAYHYEYKGNDYVSFKTRLNPILKDGKWGGFLTLWIQYLKDNQWVQDVIDMNPDYNLSFELYGYRNIITVSYRNALDAALLFGIKRENHIIKPPSQLETYIDVKLPQFIQNEGKKNFTNLYEKLRSDMSLLNNKGLVVEGRVLYAFYDNHLWKQFKCKPEEIQKIHWSNSSIPKRELWNTAINSFEDGESSIEYFIELLKEEYTNQQIGRIEQKVKRVFFEARKHVIFTQKVNKCWEEAKEQGFDILKDKADTFRFISKFFDKKEMKKVGTIILNQIIENI